MLCVYGVVLASVAAGVVISSSRDTPELLPRYNTMCTAITPPPQNEICGINGYLKKKIKQTEGNSSVPRLASCRDLCAFRSRTVGGNCTGFAYDPLTRLCALYNYPFSMSNFHQDKNSPFKFYSQDCFHCPKQCPQPPDTNIIDNGGFEFSSQLIGPWSIVEGQAEVVSPGFHSASALKSRDLISLTQSRDICGGQEYTFSVDIKIDKESRASDSPREETFLYIQAGQFQLILNYSPHAHNPGTEYGNWRTFRGTTQGLSTNNNGLTTTDFGVDFLVLSRNKKNHYDIYIDNFIVKPTSGRYQTVGKNLLINGGFESGELAPWTPSVIGQPSNSTAIITNEVVPHGLSANSKYSYKYNAEEYEQPYSKEYCPQDSNSCEYFQDVYVGSDLGGVALQQVVHTIPGQFYLLSFVYRAKNVNQLTVQIGLDDFASSIIQWFVINDGGEYPRVYEGGVQYNDFPVSDNNVRKFSRVFEAIATQSYVSLIFAGFGYRDAVANIIQVDDVSILALAKGQSL